MKLPLLAACLIAIAAPLPALAQSVKQIGEFNAWSAYSASESTGPLCFALSKPTDVDPAPDDYTEAYLYLTHRPAENVRNELNLVAGFNFAPDTPATASVGGQDFELFTQKDAAWLKDPAQNDNLAGALRAGSTLVIAGTSDKGIKITETFSLQGATAASRAVTDGCAG